MIVLRLILMLCLPVLLAFAAGDDPRKRYQKEIDHASNQIDAARKAYQAGSTAGFQSALSEIAAATERCDQILRAPGKNNARNLGQFKKAEIRLREILRRLDQLANETAVDDRKPIQAAREVVQRIHDQLLVDITSRRKLN